MGGKEVRVSQCDRFSVFSLWNCVGASRWMIVDSAMRVRGLCTFMGVVLCCFRWMVCRCLCAWSEFMLTVRYRFFILRIRRFL